jgi:LysR family positive regulator for ilvC
MNIHELKVFKHLAGTLHFGRTSRACNITPSALTRTIQRLEEEVGKKLFIRDNRSVALTRAGRLVRMYAEETIKHWHELQSELAIDDETLRGEISLYCSVTAVYSILPRMLTTYRRLHPQVHITLQTGDQANALEKLQNNEVDVTIAALPEKPIPQLRFIKVVETPLIFIGPAHFPLDTPQPDRIIDWQTMPMIMAERGLGRQRLDSWFRERGVQPNIYAQVAGNEAIITMVSLGCGIGVVPQLVLDKSPMRDQVAVLKVSPELEPFAVGVCTFQKNMANPPVQALWDVAERAVDSRGLHVGESPRDLLKKMRLVLDGE